MFRLIDIFKFKENSERKKCTGLAFIAKMKLSVWEIEFMGNIVRTGFVQYVMPYDKANIINRHYPS